MPLINIKQNTCQLFIRRK